MGAEMKKYNKALAAKNNPSNLCFAKENELLVIASQTDRMKGRQHKGDHFFTGVETGEPSQYGWVKSLETPISAEELAHMKWANPDPADIDRCELLLSSANNQKDETAMACHYGEVVSPEGKKRILKIHKIIFYKQKEQEEKP
jgi:hypothetical protein